jgi:shikimate 5-dehydrogenase
MTALLAAARAAHCITVTGSVMLVVQALAQQAVWTQKSLTVSEAARVCQEQIALFTQQTPEL